MPTCTRQEKIVCLYQSSPAEARDTFHVQDLSWKEGRKLMGNVDTFLKSLMSFDKEHIPIACVERASLYRVTNLLPSPLVDIMMAQ